MKPKIAVIGVAATRIRDADITVGAIFDPALEGKFRVSVVATGVRQKAQAIEYEQKFA
jgi:cell division protein FtsZ